MNRHTTGFLMLAFTLLAGQVALAAPGEPEQLIRSTTEEVLGTMQERKRSGQRDDSASERLVKEKILPIIEFESFAKLTLGRHWRDATPEQRRRFTGEFESMLVRTYAKYLWDYADTRVSYLPTRQDGKYVFVSQELAPGQGKTPLRVEYRFKNFNGDWRAIDVEVDGLSLVKNFRTSFVDEVNQAGLDALITRLATANEPIGASAP